MGKTVVLGAGFLGVNTALNLAGEEEVVLIDESLRHEYVPGTVDLIRERVDRDKLEKDLERFMPESIELIEGEVVAVNPEKETVETRGKIIGYDNLVLALGGKPATHGLDVSKAEHVWNLNAAEKLKEKLGDTDEAVVAGAGYVGVEVAGEVAEKGVETTLVEMKTRPTPGLTRKSSEKILETLRRKKVAFKGGREITNVNENSVETAGGEEIKGDTVIWCGGVEASEVVQESFSCGKQGVEVNRGLSAKGFDNVFAGGDCAEAGVEKTAHSAMRQASVISKNVQREAALKRYSEDFNLLVVSVGDTAYLVYGDRILFGSRILRKLKDLVRKFYWTQLRLRKRFPSARFLP